MAKAQKKPVIIDYFEVAASTRPIDIDRWVSSFGDTFVDFFEIIPVPGGLGIRVKTLEGTSYTATSENVIIRGVKGEYYPCKRDIFLQTYDILDV